MFKSSRGGFACIVLGCLLLGLGLCILRVSVTGGLGFFASLNYFHFEALEAWAELIRQRYLSMLRKIWITSVVLLSLVVSPLVSVSKDCRVKVKS